MAALKISEWQRERVKSKDKQKSFNKIYITVILILAILIVLAIKSNYFKGGFKFEDYTETGRNKQLTADLLKAHPVGSSGLTLQRKLENAGAKCRVITKKSWDIESKYRKPCSLIMCHYLTDFISFHPLYSFSVWIDIGKTNEILLIGSKIRKGVY